MKSSEQVVQIQTHKKKQEKKIETTQLLISFVVKADHTDVTQTHLPFLYLKKKKEGSSEVPPRTRCQRRVTYRV